MDGRDSEKKVMMEKDKTLSVQDQEKMLNKMEQEQANNRGDGSSYSLCKLPPPSYSESNSQNWTACDSSSTMDEWHSPSLSIYKDIPLKSLSFGARRELGVRLNPDGTIHNWKSVADELGFDNNQVCVI